MKRSIQELYLFPKSRLEDKVERLIRTLLPVLPLLRPLKLVYRPHLALLLLKHSPI